MYLNVSVCDEFELPEMAFFFYFSGPNKHELEPFHPHFVCKCSFREISIIITIILDENKLI